MHIPPSPPSASPLPAFATPPRIMLVEAPYYADIAAEMLAGAWAVLAGVQARIARFTVAGALEIPAAVACGVAQRRFDGYVGLGCVIKGDSYHFEVVCNESARGLMDLSTRHGIALGNGIITAYNLAQAQHRASRQGHDIGGRAAQACLAVLAVKNSLYQPAYDV